MGRMKIAFIEPLAHMAKYGISDMHMILPEMIHNPSYTKHFQNVQGYKILDNGAAEGVDPDQDTWAKLLDTANVLKVDEIVVPDVMGDGLATQVRALAFDRWLQAELSLRPNTFNYMGVAQGDTSHEVLSCIQTLASIDSITTLGMPRILTEQNHMTRLNLIDAIWPKVRHQFPKGIHCLGGSSWKFEPLLLADLGSVRSIDTSFPANMSLAGHDLVSDPFVSRPNDFWTKKFPSEKLAALNHLMFTQWCT